MPFNLSVISKITKAQLFKVSSLNALSILIKISIGLVTSKVIALYVGPLGMGLVGNLRNFLSFIESIATLGFQNGIVKYVAEYKEDKKQLSILISTVFIALTFVVLGISGTLFFFAEEINRLLFGTIFNYVAIIQLLALALPWYVYSAVLISIVNGLGNFKNVIRINIIGNLIGLLVSVILIFQLKTFGALASLIITPSLLFAVSFYYVQKELSLWQNLSWRDFEIISIKKLSAYSLMFFVPAVVSPLVFLEIRNHIIETLGNNEAGYWEAMSRISTYYLLFITTLASVYFFPRLAITKSVSETKLIFWSYYKWILSLFTIGLICIYFLRFYIVKILFTDAFSPVNDLFFWQLVGDVFKAASLILGFQFLAKKMINLFLITEILSLSVQYFSSIYFIQYFKIEGIVMAHAFTYFVYLAILVLIFRKVLFGRN